MKITLDNTTLDLTKHGRGYLVTFDDKTVEVEIVRVNDDKLELLVDGERVTAHVSLDNTKRWVTINGRTMVLIKSSGARRSGVSHDHASDLAAPMPGQVRSVNVVEGEAVKKGQTLMALEAMKMEIRIQAKNDGTVKKIFVKQGQTVEREQVLIEIE